MIKKMLILLLAIFTMVLVGCTSDDDASGESSTVTIWYIGGAEEAAKAIALKNAFEKTQEGVENPITLNFISKGSYADVLDAYSRGSKLPDITEIDDEYFKRMVKGDYLAELDSLIEGTDIDINSYWSNAVSRYRWNSSNNTSNDSDPLYCIPKDVRPTIMFYNKTILESVGVTIISVNEENLEAFYNGTVADNNGKMIDDYPTLKEFKGQYDKLFAKGFWCEQLDSKGCPGTGAKVFNNSVAMSWDETVQLGKLTTKAYNSQASSSYGFYNEWWFNYGWSVGGDCLGDTDGNGHYVFTLNDKNPNYKVLENCTINGHDYKVSESEMTFVSYQDKIYLAENPNKVTELGNKIQKMPSTLEAFGNFCMLTRPYGYTETYEGYTFSGVGISPLCRDVKDYEAARTQFANGSIAMFVGYSDCSYDIGTAVDWDFAPVPLYKTYDGANNVTAIGELSSQSKTTGYAISKASKNKENAVIVLEWLANEGQAILAEDGFSIPNSYETALSTYLPEVDQNKNWEVVLTAAKTQKAGDWWYMVDRDWIANWSQPLNQNSGSVRNNGYTLSEYFENTKKKTDDYLEINY